MTYRPIAGGVDRLVREGALRNRSSACPVAVCAKRAPPHDGCSHVDCPNRPRPTAWPGRDTDGAIAAKPPAP